MNIRDFNIGDKVFCVDYMSRNDPKFMNAVIDSIGRKYVRCSIWSGYRKFGEACGAYSEHYLISSNDNLMYLFKNRAAYEDYIEHMELNRKLSNLTYKSLTLNQLRRIQMIVEYNDNNVPADKAEIVSAAIKMLEIGRTQSESVTDENKNKVFIYALEVLYKQFSTMPKKSAIDDVVCCPTYKSSLHRYNSIYFKCNVPCCKWCGQVLDWQEFDSEEVSDEVKNTD